MTFMFIFLFVVLLLFLMGPVWCYDHVIGNKGVVCMLFVAL